MKGLPLNVITRGMRNAFRNAVRTFSITIILGLSIGLALTMLVARQAVQAKIASVKSSIGNTITITPAGAQGFQGGGEPLTEAEITKVKAVAHVTNVVEKLQDRLQTTNTNLVSAIEAGTLGRRNNSSSTTTASPAATPKATTGTSTTTTGQNAPGGGGKFTPPVTLTGANTLDGAVLEGSTSLTMKSGDKFDPTKDANVAIVGTTLATKNNLTVGSTFTAYGTTVKVVGIYDAGTTFANNSVIMPLVTVQKLSSQVGDISSATVTVDDIINVDGTVKAITSTLGSSVADVTSTQASASTALAPLENIKTISTYSLLGAVGAGAMIILLTMTMIVRERRREIGVLKAIGASNLKVMFQFVTEAITLTVLGAIVGLAIGVAAAAPVASTLSSVASSASTTTQTAGGFGGPGGGGGRAFARIAGVSTQSLRTLQVSVGWEILLYGLGAAIIIAILGSAIPSLLIAKVRPAEVMRAE